MQHLDLCVVWNKCHGETQRNEVRRSWNELPLGLQTRARGPLTVSEAELSIK